MLASEVARAVPALGMAAEGDSLQCLKRSSTHSAEETTSGGREFAKRLQAPVLVLLTGDLGTERPR